MEHDPLIIIPGVIDCRKIQMGQCRAQASLPEQNCMGFQDSHCFSDGPESDLQRLEAESVFVFFAVEPFAMVVAIRLLDGKKMWMCETGVRVKQVGMWPPVYRKCRGF
jgi:hypothetical protein